ncbi:hypothetical protein SH2C18_50090 [Clostridium sediminicola]
MPKKEKRKNVEKSKFQHPECKKERKVKGEELSSTNYTNYEDPPHLD